MVNRHQEFNRRRQNRAKTIRDKKKGRINNKKLHLGLLDKDAQRGNEEVSKKTMKKQKNLENIYQKLNVKEDLSKKKHLKRRNHRKSGKGNKQNEEEMKIDQ